MSNNPHQLREISDNTTCRIFTFERYLIQLILILYVRYYFVFNFSGSASTLE